MGGEAVYAGFGHRERMGREGDGRGGMIVRDLIIQGFGENEKRRGRKAAAGLGLVFWGNFEPMRYFFSFLRREMIIRMMQTMKPRAQMGPAVLMHLTMKAPDRSFGVL